MPYKAGKPCANNGCKKITDKKFCDEHLKEYNYRYNHYERDKRHNVRYGSKWRKLRQLYIMRHPLCEICYANKIYTKTQEVHHIILLSKGGSHSINNLQSLCKPCHSRITAKDGDRWG